MRRWVAWAINKSEQCVLSGYGGVLRLTVRVGFCVVQVLTLKGWTLQDWNKLYNDLPSKQDKLAVADRTMFKPTDDETRLIEPAPLQSKIDEFVAAVPCGRAFVRPSGTENVVRLYAEAETSEQANELAGKIMQAIKDLGFA